jgi:hypothetical protein
MTLVTVADDVIQIHFPSSAQLENPGFGGSSRFIVFFLHDLSRLATDDSLALSTKTEDNCEGNLQLQ